VVYGLVFVRSFVDYFTQRCRLNYCVCWTLLGLRSCFTLYLLSTQHNVIFTLICIMWFVFVITFGISMIIVVALHYGFSEPLSVLLKVTIFSSEGL